MKVALAAALSLGAVACNGGVFDDDDVCGIAMAVSGAINTTVAADAEVTCFSYARFTFGVVVGFTVPEQPVTSVSISNDTVEIGHVAQNQPVSVRIEAGADAEWSNDDCLLDVVDSEPLTREPPTYRIVGSFACAEPLPYYQPGINNPLVLESFDFVATVTSQPSPF